MDSISGQPIPDVIVSGVNCQQKIVTDAAGRFALECPYSFDGGFLMSKPGYVMHGVQGYGVETSDEEGSTVRRQIVRRMWWPAKIVGRVIDATGSPARNIAVTATSATREETSTTGADGRFELFVAPASYRLCAVSSCLPAEVTAIREKEAAPLVIRLPMEKTWSITGRVLTQIQKTPDWTTRVWAIARSKPEFYRGSVDDLKDSFVISGLKTGFYTLLFRAGPANQCYTCPMPPEYEQRIPMQVSRDTTGMVITISPFSVITGPKSVILDSGLPSRFSVPDRIRIGQVPPGRYLVVQDESESQLLRTVLLDGQPAVHGEIQVAPRSSPHLEIAFQDAAASISVRVEGSGFVLAVPENAWQDAVGPIRVTGSAILGVSRPGTYLVFAVQNLAAYPVREWADLLKRHERQATRASVPGPAITVKAFTFD